MPRYWLNGNEVKVLAARVVPVWVTYLPLSIVRHYSKPTNGGSESQITKEELSWHVRIADMNGKTLHAGKWMTIDGLTTQGVHDDLINQLGELAPAARERMNVWLASESAIASKLVDTVPRSQVV